ncbi:hypothetical protein PAPYR_7803 [Paratrimastix pyriformis]|uniref:SHSP domain-containing protein n=1 Tax=Paratrimastix pyriformis TaxID=342808 RepID=A0ABQ8UES4_9EUKA|nr:hypothetical protein PAPYR_7803 [Paratrimastix pyriformis]
MPRHGGGHHSHHSHHMTHHSHISHHHSHHVAIPPPPSSTPQMVVLKVKQDGAHNVFENEYSPFLIPFLPQEEFQQLIQEINAPLYALVPMTGGQICCISCCAALTCGMNILCCGHGAEFDKAHQSALDQVRAAVIRANARFQGREIEIELKTPIAPRWLEIHLKSPTILGAAPMVQATFATDSPPMVAPAPPPDAVFNPVSFPLAVDQIPIQPAVTAPATITLASTAPVTVSLSVQPPALTVRIPSPSAEIPPPPLTGDWGSPDMARRSLMAAVRGPEPISEEHPLPGEVETSAGNGPAASPPQGATSTPKPLLGGPGQEGEIKQRAPPINSIMFAYYSTPNPLEHFYYGRNFFDEMMTPLLQSFSFLFDDTTPQSTPSADTRSPFTCECESTTDPLMQLFCSMMFPACCQTNASSCCCCGGDQPKLKQPAASPKAAKADGEPAPACAATEAATATATAAATATGGETAPATASSPACPETPSATEAKKDQAAVHWLAPRCDVEENADEVLLHVELPGVPRELVHLDADPARGMLTLTAHAPRRGADYRRVFRLPQSCQPRLGEITAACADGVMTVRCPKAVAPQSVIIPIQ